MRPRNQGVGARLDLVGDGAQEAGAIAGRRVTVGCECLGRGPDGTIDISGIGGMIGGVEGSTAWKVSLVPGTFSPAINDRPVN